MSLPARKLSQDVGLPESQKDGPTAARREPGPPPIPRPVSEAGVPLLPSGDPDQIALQVRGRADLLQEYSRRLRCVAWVRAELKKVPQGERMKTYERAAIEFDTSDGSGKRGLSVATVRRWLHALQNGGKAALMPTRGLKRGPTAIPAELQTKILEAYYDFTARTTRQLYGTVVKPYCAAEEVDAPTYSTVRRFIRKATEPMAATFYRKGPRAWQAQFAAKVVRDPESCEVNQVWCADHRLCDVMVLYGGKPRRPWVTMIADVRTAAFVGYALCLRPRVASVAEAIRRAILAVGVPEIYLRDNGKEFASKRLGGKAARLRRPRASDLGDAGRWPAPLPAQLENGGLWTALGVEVVTSLPYHAWSKPIESFFGAFAGQWENLVPGYTGRDAKAKPEILKKHIAEGKLLAWPDFERIFGEQVRRWNTERPHGKRRQTPAAAYVGHVARIPEDGALAVLLQGRGEYRVQPHGLEVGGRLYQSEALALHVGQKIHVRYGDGAGPLYVYPPRGGAIAVPEAPKARWDNAFTEANRLAKRAERAQKSYLLAMRRELHGACTPEELDPTGAFRKVVERAQEQTAASEVLALPAAEETAARQKKAAKDVASEGTPTPDWLRRKADNVFREDDDDG